MADYHTVYKGAEGETTEWDDLQRKHGNFAPKEPVWKPDAYAPKEEPCKGAALVAAAAAGGDADALDAMEEDAADDRFLEDYRRRRLEELRRGSARPRFGSLEVIRGSEFVAEVTGAGEGVWAVCHLFRDAVPDCAILNQCLDELAPRFPATKFVKIVSTDCIPGYPDANLPTLLLYKDGKCVKSLVGLAAVGGRETSPDRVALALNCHGAVCDEGGGGGGAAAVRSLVADLVERRAERGGSDEDSDFD